MGLKLILHDSMNWRGSEQKTVASPVNVPINFRILQQAGSFLTNLVRLQTFTLLRCFAAWVCNYRRLGKTYQHELLRSTRRCSWLRHFATSWKVVGTIPDGVIGIFYWHNPSGRTVAPGSTQPTERQPVCRLTTLPNSCADCLEICEPQPHGTLWAGTQIVLHLPLKAMALDLRNVGKYSRN